MEEHTASSEGAREVREVAAAREPVAEAKRDVKEAEAKVAEAKKDVKEAEAKVNAAEAKVNAAMQVFQQASNPAEKEDASTELKYARETRELALHALKSSQEARAVREKILNALLLQESGVMQSCVLCAYCND
jgi:chromosome segregation ATPase